jgi:hypothetical protein
MRKFSLITEASASEKTGGAVRRESVIVKNFYTLPNGGANRPGIRLP